MISYADQLRQIRNSLTLENWNKGSYFSTKNNTICMCVHGAGQALVNPQVKKALENNKVVAAAVFVARARRRAGALGAPVARVARDACDIMRTSPNKDLLSVWKNRPDWVKKERFFNSISYGFVSLHWLMGMFGITVDFNDNSNTTLDMLKDKLSEAAKWAEENEEFLQDN